MAEALCQAAAVLREADVYVAQNLLEDAVFALGGPEPGLSARNEHAAVPAILSVGSDGDVLTAINAALALLDDADVGGALLLVDEALTSLHPGALSAWGAGAVPA